VKIVSIQESGPKKRTCFITFDNGLELRISKSVVGALGLKKGFECALAEDEFLLLIADTATRFGRKKAFDLIARRDYTVFEMRQRLERDGYDKKLTDELIAHLLRLDLLNDDRYIEGFCATRLQAGYGPHVIAQKLLQKGIKEDAVRDALVSYIEKEEFDLEESAREQIAKYDLSDHKESQRAFRKLVARGFNYGLARNVISGTRDVSSLVT